MNYERDLIERATMDGIYDGIQKAVSHLVYSKITSEILSIYDEIDFEKLDSTERGIRSVVKEVLLKLNFHEL